MRPVRIRFTIRLLMAVVAILAVALAGVAWSHWMRLREDYRLAASYHEEKEQYQHQQLEGVAKAREIGRGDDPLLPLIERLAQRRAEYHAEMRRKYEEAAAHPWEPVPPDPSEPSDERLVRNLDSLGPLQPIDPDSVKFLDPRQPIDPDSVKFLEIVPQNHPIQANGK
jgi:hypothetical protein